MAVRGLGCPVRFALTAGQKGDAPQAAALIEGLSAEIVMADTAYDADHLRQASPPKARSPSSPTIRHARSKPLDKHLYAQRHLVEPASQSSSSSAASQPASKRPPETTAPLSLSLPSSYGLDKCLHRLVCQRVGAEHGGCPLRKLTSYSWSTSRSNKSPNFIRSALAALNPAKV